MPKAKIGVLKRIFHPDLGAPFSTAHLPHRDWPSQMLLGDVSGNSHCQQIRYVAPSVSKPEQSCRSNPA